LGWSAYKSGIRAEAVTTQHVPWDEHGMELVIGEPPAEWVVRIAELELNVQPAVYPSINEKFMAGSGREGNGKANCKGHGGC